MASARLRLHGGRHHVLASLGYVAQQVAQEVHPAEAVLPSAPLGATPGEKTPILCPHCGGLMQLLDVHLNGMMLLLC